MSIEELPAFTHKELVLFIWDAAKPQRLDSNDQRGAEQDLIRSSVTESRRSWCADYTQDKTRSVLQGLTSTVICAPPKTSLIRFL